MNPLDDNDEWETSEEAYYNYLISEVFLPTAKTEQAVKELLDLVVRTYNV